MLREKTAEELDVLENEIKITYGEQTFKMDISYWERVLRKIRQIRAKNSLNQFYMDFDSKQDKQIIMNTSDIDDEMMNEGMVRFRLLNYRG